MSASEVTVDEQALSEVSEAINAHVQDCREVIADAVKKLKLNSENWNDEDFNALVSAINSFMADIEQIQETVTQLSRRIGSKLSAIQELHNMKI